MRKFLLGVIVSLISTQALTEPPSGESAPDSKDVSYSYGAVLGKRMQNDIPDLDVAAFVQGFSDAAAAKPTRLSEAQMQAVISSFQRELQQRQLEKRQQMAAENLKAEAVFLLENRKQAGVVELPSGLQYKILVEGNGPQASLSDVVKLHYTSALRNGQVLDTSRQGVPVEVAVSGAIPGWSEALQLMPQGSKWQLFIPSKLAYGPNGNRQIGPNELLIYEVEVLEVKHK